MRRKRPYTEPDRIKERISKSRTRKQHDDATVDWCSTCLTGHPKTPSGLSICCGAYMVTGSRANFAERHET